MLSICQLHLQLPFDDCPTVAAACSDSGTVVVCACVYAITASLLTMVIRGSYVSYSFP